MRAPGARRAMVWLPCAPRSVWAPPGFLRSTLNRQLPPRERGGLSLTQRDRFLPEHEGDWPFALFPLASLRGGNISHFKADTGVPRKSCDFLEQGALPLRADEN